MSPAQDKCLHKVTHCIFDNDGTLMDTEKQYETAVSNLLRPYGEKYTYDLKLQCMGMPTSKSTRFLVEKLNLPIDGATFEQMFNDEVHRQMGNVELMPGVKDLILHLHHHRVPMAIGTSAQRKVFVHKASSHCDIMPAFRHIVCGDDPELVHGKPAPDIFLLAASRFKPKPQPQCCLVFEDSPIGKQAALAAGMQVVMIPDPRVPEEQTKDATIVLRSMADFQPELFGLPPYDNCDRFTFG
ncbi:probable pseudouridine-5'-phosphatase [Drosophila sulfurigaster albostrigata]|uniref:probable pseudouridine-5'-phosphatase n=1 Tax=Drosophila sulfurigaster albostrigata TaxID=89887 RepID=UPI002D21CD23|nr:probable pseudouridine-5'-phosphatase [Drosophila sulfurigaster albostrigata]